MANTVNYATIFEREINQKYARELLTTELTSQGIRFIGGNTIKIPYVSVGGYKEHSRAGGFNRQPVANDFQTATLAFDRDVEFFVDAMDVDESNLALSAANITNVFITEQAIPETDSYRISKLYADFVAQGGAVDGTALDATNIIQIWDTAMQAMDDAGVPAQGRIVYVTPAVNTLFKNAFAGSRSLIAPDNGRIYRAVHNLDDVTIKMIPSVRMKTAYDFSDGWTPESGALQINFILIHPTAVVAVDKHQYIKLWPEGSHTAGDGYLYQNRKYGDLFLLKNKVDGVYINAEAEAEQGSGGSSGNGNSGT
ncbi:MAG: capsid protein [Clostridiales bacterium]|nr:capsid protein [Clostridiales bacterium]